MEVEAGIWEVPGQPQLHCELKVSLGYKTKTNKRWVVLPGPSTPSCTAAILRVEMAMQTQTSEYPAGDVWLWLFAKNKARQGKAGAGTDRSHFEHTLDIVLEVMLGKPPQSVCLFNLQDTLINPKDLLALRLALCSLWKVVRVWSVPQDWKQWYQ